MPSLKEDKKISISLEHPFRGILDIVYSSVPSYKEIKLYLSVLLSITLSVTYPPIEVLIFSMSFFNNVDFPTPISPVKNKFFHYTKVLSSLYNLELFMNNILR